MEDGTWRVDSAPLRIEVKVLVGGEPGSKGAGRRISKAAFAQIRATDLLDPQTAEPLGTPLARIHLPSEDCDEKPVEDEHIHVLWQQGSDLRFSCVPRDPWAEGVTEHRHRHTLDDEIQRELRNLRYRSTTLQQAARDLRLLEDLRGQVGRHAPEEDGSDGTAEEEQIYTYVEDLPPRRRLSYEEDRFREECEFYGRYYDLGLQTNSAPAETQQDMEALEQEVDRLEIRREEFREHWREIFDRLACLEQVYVGL